MPGPGSAEAVGFVVSWPRLGFWGLFVAKSKADEYRAKARECEELAQGARDPFIRQQCWRSLKSGGPWRHSKRSSAASW